MSRFQICGWKYCTVLYLFRIKRLYFKKSKIISTITKLSNMDNIDNGTDNVTVIHKSRMLETTDFIYVRLCVHPHISPLPSAEFMFSF